MKNQQLQTWTILTLVALANLIFFDVFILLAPPKLQVTYTPDDAYYYFSLARNFVTYHTWTFDANVSQTTGFHPMLAYLLAWVYWLVNPSADSFVRIGLLISNFFTIFTVLYLLWIGLKRKQPFVLASLAILISWRNVLLNSVSGVEWPQIVFITTLFCVTMATNYTARKGRIALFMLGMLGSLARSDFGLLPLAFFLASLVLWKTRGEKEILIAASLGLSGAVFGVGVLFLHNYFFTGLLVQSSALMKSHWMAGRYNLKALLIGVCGLLSSLLLYIVAAKKGGFRKLWRDLSAIQQLFGIAALLSWLGYAVFYTKAGDIQPWYSVNFLVPLFVFLSALAIALAGSPERFTKLSQLVLFSLFALVFLQTLLGSYPIDSQNSQWPHQQAMLEAGKYLRDHPLDQKTGSWNAGVINYYQGGEIVNLDGLVNNDVYPYVLSNSLPAYLSQKNIRYVIDFDVVLVDIITRRGGYANAQFLSSLAPLVIFDDVKVYDPNWKNLTLYEIR